MPLDTISYAAAQRAFALATSLAPAARGDAGKKYRMILGVIRNAGSGSTWDIIDPTDGYHLPTGLDASVMGAGAVTMPGDGTIQVNYANLASTAVAAVIAVPDETLAIAGIDMGTSVQKGLSLITLAKDIRLSDYLVYPGTGSVLSKTRGASSPYTIDMTTFASTGDIKITHGSVGTADIFNFALATRGVSGYRAVVSDTSGAVTDTQIIVNLVNSAGTIVKVLDSACRLYLTRFGRAQINAAGVNQTTYPGSNIWLVGAAIV